MTKKEIQQFKKSRVSAQTKELMHEFGMAFLASAFGAVLVAGAVYGLLITQHTY